MRHAFAVLVPLFLSACAGMGTVERDLAGADPEVGACLEAYELIDRAVDQAGVRDAEAHRLAGFPYLRVNRFLASFADRDLSGAQFRVWVLRMAALDREGRSVELMNLPPPAHERLERDLADAGGGLGAKAVVERCPPVLERYDLAASERQGALRAAATVPDDYSLLARTLGVYPLSAIPIAMGYQRWKQENLATFRTPPDQIPWQGRPVLYAPAASLPPLAPPEVKALLSRAQKDALGIPKIEDADLARLAATFAPDFLVDVASGADPIGRPVWNEDGVPGVDTSDPAAFVRLSYAWFEGKVVPQLVYQIWFAARPGEGGLDLLGGRLDGLVWRVTLDPDGVPLVYDTIHACGCYQLFFPAPGVKRKPLPQDAISDIRETDEVPQRAPGLAPGERLVVRVAAASHYVSRLTTTGEAHGGRAKRSYRLVIGASVPDAALRSMPLQGGGRRSLYGPDGLVAGTERRERWILWPMGIASAGAMRQWGHHATAFVGERQFDDPDLIERGFAR